tara:strand:- start:483 stop:1289 length:807 start_codon:yes stop_codon:yes gene_type:complete
MLLTIKHRTTYEYEVDPYRVGLRLMMFPRNLPAQNVQHWAITVNGEVINKQFENAFGEGEAIWLAYEPETPLELIAEGIFEVKDNSGVVCVSERKVPSEIFLRQTHLTQPDEAIRKLALGLPSKASLEMAHALSNIISERILYLPGKTDSATTAADVLKNGAGVCQDHTHLMISIAREIGVPARYVVGYLFEPDRKDELRETHAWAELQIDGLGWVGFDPSNQVCPTDHYVRLTSGFDANDAAPISGILVGTCAETMDVEVSVDCVSQ